MNEINLEVENLENLKTEETKENEMENQETQQEAKEDVKEVKEEVKESKDSKESKEVQVRNGTLEVFDGEGKLVFKNMDDMFRVSKAIMKFLPKHYDTPEKVMAGIIFAKELGLSPMNALRNIAIINGSPSIWGELPLAVVRSSGLLEKIDEFLIDKDYKKICFENKNIGADVFAAICIIKRKGYEEKSFFLTKEDAAKNPNFNSAVWKSYFKVMIKRRVRTIALKDEFGDLLSGAPIAEYDFNYAPDLEGGEKEKKIERKNVVDISDLQ